MVENYFADLVPYKVSFDGQKNKFCVRIFWHLFFSMMINLTGLFFLGGNLPFFNSKIAETTSVSARTLPFSFSLFFFLFFFFLLFFFLRKSPFRDKEKTLCDVDENWFLSTKLPYQPQFRLINNFGNHIFNILINTAIITSIGHKSETCFCSSSTLLQDKLCSILPSPPDSTLQSTLSQTVMVVKGYDHLTIDLK